MKSIVSGTSVLLMWDDYDFLFILLNCHLVFLLRSCLVGLEVCIYT